MSAERNANNPVELTRIQQWFQAVITHAEGVEAGAGSSQAQALLKLGPGELERVVTRSRALTAAERLAIYANAYHHRLLECLGEVFPMLKRTLGDDAFDSLAFGYLQVYPSRTYTLNELGRQFPPFLEQTRPSADVSAPAPVDEASDTEVELMQDWPDFLIDLARLEWAIYEVFDGPGTEQLPPLGAEQLSVIPPEQWPKATLVPALCLQLLQTRFPVNDYYTALRRAKPEDAVPMPLAKESFLALTRRDYVVRRHALSATQFKLLQAILAGQPIGEAVQGALPADGAEVDQLAAELQAWFRAWTANGFFQSIRL